MRTVTLVATVHMTGIKKEYRQKAANEFVRCYDEIVSETNPQYEKWNREYDAKYYYLNNTDGSVWQEHYDAWIACKIEEQINRKERSKFLEFDVNPDGCVITGHIKGYKNRTSIIFEFDSEA